MSRRKSLPGKPEDLQAAVDGTLKVDVAGSFKSARRGSNADPLGDAADSTKMDAGKDAEMSYIGQLGTSRQKVDALMSAAEEKLAQLIGTTSENFTDDLGALHGVMEWLGRAAFGEVESLSDAHRQTSRDALKTQSITLEMKLSTSRKAAQVALQDKSAEMEATMHKKLEKQLEVMKGDSGEALNAAHHEIEELKGEMGTLKLKMTGVEEALSMTKGILRQTEQRLAAAEAKATESTERADKAQAEADAHAEEFKRCKELLDKALAELDVTSSKNQSLEEKVTECVQEIQKLGADYSAAKRELEDALTELGITKDENMTMKEQIQKLVGETAKAIEENAAAKKELEDALTELGIAKDENMTMKEQIQKLVQEAALAQELQKERDRLAEQVGQMKKALETLDEKLRTAKAQAAEEQAALKADVGRLTTEVEEERAKNASGGAKLAAAEARIGELEKAISKLEKESEGAREQISKLEAKLAESADAQKLLDAERAKVASLSACVDRALKALKSAAGKASLPELQPEGVSKETPAEARAAAVADCVERATEVLLRSHADLASTRADKAKLEKEHTALGGKAAEYQAKNAGLEEEVAGLKQELKELKQEIEDLGKGAGASAGQASKMQAEIKRCIELIMPVLSAKEQKVAKSKLPGCVDALLARVRSVENQLLEMQEQLAAGEAAVLALRGALEEAQQGNSGELAACEQREKKKRAALVESALESMRHLRTHLISTLSGLREVSNESPQDFGKVGRVTSDRTVSTTAAPIPPPTANGRDPSGISPNRDPSASVGTTPREHPFDEPTILHIELPRPLRIWGSMPLSPRNVPPVTGGHRSPRANRYTHAPTRLRDLTLDRTAAGTPPSPTSPHHQEAVSAPLMRPQPSQFVQHMASRGRDTGGGLGPPPPPIAPPNGKTNSPTMNRPPHYAHVDDGSGGNAPAPTAAWSNNTVAPVKLRPRLPKVGPNSPRFVAVS